MIIIKSPQEIEAMRRAGAIAGRFFEEVKRHVRSGVATLHLEEIAEEFVAKHGVRGAFKGYHGSPANLCTSINEEVVHGIPSGTRVLREGDIVSIDFGVVLDGFYGDAARTFAVGKISIGSEKLLSATERALEKAIAVSLPGNRLGGISSAVQEGAEGAGGSGVRGFVGAGAGRALHEEPQVPNFGTPGTGPKLMPGAVLAIEHMGNGGRFPVDVLPDGRTVARRA